MAQLRYLLMMSTIAINILTQGEARGQKNSNVKHCEQGENCMDKENCPEYLKYLKVQNQTKKTEMIKTLRGKVCNINPHRLCCQRTLPKSYLPGVGQCGVSFSAKSVIHGEEAILGEYPWAVLLGSKKTFEQWDNKRKKWGYNPETIYHCGGTLINTWYVLTAAHCHTEEKQIVEVVLGEWDVLTDPDCPVGEEGCDNPRVQRQEVEDVIIHGGYDKNSKAKHNDIALIKMKTEAQLNIFVQLACLPLPEYNLPNYFYNPVFLNATVVGWGNSSNKVLTKEDLIYHGLSTRILQKGRMPIQPLEQCGKAYKRLEIKYSQLCAGGNKLNIKTDSCKGDSGGGLFADSGDHSGQSSGNVHVQVGLVSYGYQLCGDYPAVYTKIDQFIPWIKDVIGF